MVAPPVEIVRMVNPAPVMPFWLQVLVWFGMALAVVGLIWTKLIKPLHALASSAAVLQEIVAQFRTDSGSSLRDVVNRIELSADKTERALEKLNDRVYDLSASQGKSQARSDKGGA